MGVFLTYLDDVLIGHWADEGCEEAPRCLECPLAVCRYDEPLRGRPPVTKRRDAMLQETFEAAAAELPRTAALNKTAVIHGITLRTVQRSLARSNAAGS